MSVLEVENIRKAYGKAPVLKGISFSLEKGEVLSVIGSSGSGKTTLLRCLNFLETPEAGCIRVNGETLLDAADPATMGQKAIREKRLHFGLVFQQFNLFPQYTVQENVTLAKKLLARERLKKVRQLRGPDRSAADLLRHRPGGRSAAFPGGDVRQGRKLPPSAFRRTAAAGGHCPGAGPEAGYSVL